MILSKILGAGLAGALILSVVQSVRLASAKEVIQRLEGWQGDVVTAIRLASASPEVTADTAKGQVQAMGQSLSTLNAALTKSNDLVEEMGRQKAEADSRAEAESRARAEAIKRADSLAAQLRAGASKPVSPAEMEKEVRRVQDLAYDAGV
jgi:predicted house-cleaning NTP pyrophosphatase (Maf/HAM1 superfamily)